MAKVTGARFLNAVKVVEKETTFLDSKESEMETSIIDGISFLRVKRKKMVLYIPLSNVAYLVITEEPAKMPQANVPQPNFAPQGSAPQVNEPQGNKPAAAALQGQKGGIGGQRPTN